VEETVSLLQAAGRDHIPVMPAPTVVPFSDIKSREHSLVPASKDRTTIDATLTEIVNAEWYRGQIIYRRTFEAKAEQIGQQGAVSFAYGFL
jgi:hypothetical protein